MDVDGQRSYRKCGHVDVHQRSLRSSPLLSAQVWCPYNEAAGGGFGGGSASKPKSTSSSVVAVASSGAAAASSSAGAANGRVAAASRGVGAEKSSAAAGPPRKRQRVDDNSSDDEDPGQDPAPTCSWSGSYGDLLSKHLAQCPLHIIKCPNGCGTDIKRADIGKHAKVCKKSFEYCTICGEAVRPGMMEEHR